MTCRPNSDSAERNVCSLSTLIDLEDSPPCSFRENQECFKKARHARQEVTRILGHTARFSTALVFWCKLNVPDWLCVSPRATSHYRSGFESSEHSTILETSDHTRSCFRSELGFSPLRKSLRSVDQRLTWVHGADSKPSTCAAPQPQEA